MDSKFGSTSSCMGRLSSPAASTYPYYTPRQPGMAYMYHRMVFRHDIHFLLHLMKASLDTAFFFKPEDLKTKIDMSV